jgi:hypothetical protein
MIASSNVDIISFHIKDFIYYITLEKNIEKNEIFSLIEKAQSVAQSN